MKQLAIIIISIITCCFSSCDLERLPYGSYIDEDIKDDPANSLNSMLNGCYGQMKDWADQMHRIGEYAGDNIMIRGSSTDNFYPFISYAHTTSNYRLSNFWNNSYKIISQSSEIFKLVPEGQSEDVDQKLGEAYYLRGTMYFYLCRVFGRPYYQSPEANLGVPIVNGLPEDMSNLKLPDRSTVKETYAQAITDLKKSEELMTSKKTAAYASKAAAQAMLSRIYLYMSGTYENPNAVYADSAIYYANEVINSGEYKLLNKETFMKYNTYSPEDGAQTETIFAVKRVASEYSGDDYYYNIGGMYATIQGMGWGEMYASAKYLDLLLKSGNGNRANDARWTFIQPQYETDDSGNKTDNFRFIIPVYNTNQQQTGYNYVQNKLNKVNGKLVEPYEFTQDYKDGKGNHVKTVTYQLSHVNDDIYKVSDYEIMVYNGEQLVFTTKGDFTGDKDYTMSLNRVYPMFYIYKCSLQEGQAQLHSPIISRLAELYLNLAEAYAKKGDYANALVNLNIIRERAVTGGGYSSLDANNAAQKIDEERTLELAFEAHRSFDVYRIGHTLTRRYPGPHNAMEDIPATDNRVVQYIPQSEINAYPGTLTQNP